MAGSNSHVCPDSFVFCVPCLCLHSHPSLVDGWRREGNVRQAGSHVHVNGTICSEDTEFAIVPHHEYIVPRATRHPGARWEV
jgi:hypothetical protein